MFSVGFSVSLPVGLLLVVRKPGNKCCDPEVEEEERQEATASLAEVISVDATLVALLSGTGWDFCFKRRTKNKKQTLKTFPSGKFCLLPTLAGVLFGWGGDVHLESSFETMGSLQLLLTGWPAGKKDLSPLDVIHSQFVQLPSKCCLLFSNSSYGIFTRWIK